MNEKLLTIQEAAKKLKVSTKTLRRWEANGTLVPGRTTGAHRRYTEEQITSFIQNLKAAKTQKTTAPTPPVVPPVFQQSHSLSENVADSTPKNVTSEPAPFAFTFTQPIPEEPKATQQAETPAQANPIATQPVASEPAPISEPLPQSTPPTLAEQPIPVTTHTPIPADSTTPPPPPPSIPSFHFGRRQTAMLGSAVVGLILILIVITMGYRGLSSNSHVFSAKIDSEKLSMEKSVLAATSRPASTGKGLKGIFNVNIPTYFNDEVYIKNKMVVSGESNFDGDVYISGKKFVVNSDISAPNVVYSINAGDGVSTSGGQDITINNTGVLSLQGRTGDVTLEAGSGITIDGTKISSTVTAPSASNSFATISDGSNSFSAGSSTDTLTFLAGTGISLSLDTTNKKVTITGTSASPVTSIGDGLELNSGVASVSLLSTGTGTGSLSSASGLEFEGGSNQLTLLQGCGNSQILKWNSSSKEWECANDSGGSSGIINVKSNNAVVTSTADTLDFGPDFTTTESPVGEINLGIDYTSSHITRDNQTQTIGSAWTFSGGVTLTGLSSASGTNLCVDGSNNVIKCSAGGVTSLNSLSGALTIANSTTGGSTITIDDASAVAKGIASFNSTNFSVSSGAVNTVQNINSAASPTFSGLTLSSLSSAGIVHNNGSGTLSTSALNLAGGATEVTGILPTTNGGTGLNTSASTGVPSISSGTWSIAATLATTLGGLGADVTPAGAGELLYSTSGSAYGHLAAGTPGTCLVSGGAGAPSWSSCAGATGLANYWNQTNGALSPFNSTVDLLIGGQSSSSAKFAVLNVNTTNPSASVSGSLGGTYITADGSIQTSNRQTLTIGGTTSGSTLIYGLGTGVVHSTNGVLSSSAVTNAELQNSSITVSGGTGLGVSGSPVSLGGTLTLSNTGVTSNVAGTGISLNQGTGAVTITNTGVLSVVGGTGGSAITGALTLANAQTSGATITIDDATTASKGISSFNATNFSVSSGAVNTIQNIDSAATPTFAGLTLSNLNGNNAILYGTSGTGLITSATTSTAGLCLVSGGSNPTWTSCAGATGITSYWDQNLGALSPKNSTVDLLVGGSSSSSAKFAILNVNNGTPTASVSAGLTGGTYLTADGILATTNKQQLTLGNATTGNTNVFGLGTGVVHSTNGTLSTAQVTNAELQNSSITVSGGTGLGVSGSPVSLGGTLTLSNTGVTSNVAGTGISLNQGTGAVTITNTGVLSVVGGTGGSAITGALTLANAQTSGATITIDDATTAAKGIASFNATNFSVSSGAVDTIQNINTGAAPTFTSLTLSNFTGNNAVLYGTAGSGILSSATTNSTGLCLVSSGSNPIWASCPGGSGNTQWDITSGAIYSGNTTLDLLLGGNSTASAKFAILGVNNARGQQIASLSGSLTLDSIGALQTTMNQSLTIGGNTTGNIFVSPQNGTGTLTLTTAASNGIIINGDAGINISGTAQCVTTTNGIVTGTGVCQLGTEQWVAENGTVHPGILSTDLLIGGSTTASAKFAFINNAAGLPTASISAGLAGSLYLTADGTISTTNKQQVTIGSATSGNINVFGLGTGVVHSTNGTLSTSVVTNAELQNSSITVTGGTGLGVSGSPVSLGGTLTLSNTGVTSNVAGTGISLNQGTGAVTITNTGVLSVVGGTGGSAITGALTLANAQTSGATITIDDATTGSKGIASFNNTNFSVSSGAVNTIQNIDTGATPTFAGLTLSGLTLTGFNNCTLKTDGSGVTQCGTDSIGTNYWTQSSGTLAPTNSTLDILVGGTSTSSARFGILNVNSGTPTASLSAGLTGGSYLTADGILATTAKQQLTLGNSTTGNVNVFGLGTGVVHSTNGTLSTSVVTNAELQNSSITVSGGTGLGVSGSPVSLGGTLTLSNTGVTSNVAGTGISLDQGTGAVTITNTGVLSVVGGTGGSAITGALTLANAQTSGATITIDDASAVAKGIASFNSTNFSVSSGAVNTVQNINSAATPTFAGLTLSNFTGNNAVLYGTAGSGLLTTATTNTAGQCLVSGGSNPTWVDCGTASGTTNYFSVSNGALYPSNLSLDLLIGGTSTNSARFALTGVATDSPVASISASNGNGIYLTNTGNIATTNNQSLTFGGASTGNINFSLSSPDTIQINGTSILDSSRNLSSIAGLSTNLNPTAANTYNLGTGTGNQFNSIYGNTIYQNGNQVCDSSGNCIGGGAGGIGGSGNTNYVAKFSDASHITSSLLYDNGVASAFGTSSPVGYLTVNGGYGANAALTVNQTGAGNEIITASSSGTTRFTIDTSGNLNIIGGEFRIGGAQVLTSTALGSTVVSSSLTSTAALNAGSIASGFGTILTTNTIQGSDITASGTTGFTASGNDADLTFSGSGTHTVAASSGTLELGAATLAGAVNGNSQNITNLGTINGLAITANTGTITSGTWNGTVIGSQYGGTGQNFSSSTGVPTLSSGTWSVSAQLSAQRGGTGIDTSSATGVPTIASGTWSTLSQLSTALGGLGADVTAAGAGELLYSTGTTTYGHLAAGSPGTCLVSSGAGAPSWTSCANATGIATYWNQSNGVLYPNNSTVDFLLGGQATTSARFAVLNVNNGTPTASVSAGLAGASYITADGILATTNKQQLTLGSATSGNINVFGLGTGVVHSTNGTLSTSAITNAELQNSSITVSGGTGLGVSGSPVSLGGTLTLSNTGVTSNVAGTGISLNQGTGAVTITNTGVLSVVGGTGGSAITGALTLANAQTSGATITIDDATTAAKGIASFNSTNFSVSSGAVNTIQNIDTSATPTFGGLTLSGFTGNNAILYGTAGSGLLTTATTNTTGQCLVSGASNPSWSDCASATGITTYWNQNNGVLSPKNTSVDFLIGGSGSSSAKFAVLNVNNGTPTASVSAGLAGASYITADGTLATTAKQQLTLGNSTTGNINIFGLGTGVVHSTNGTLSTSAVTNAELQNSSITVSGGTGLGVSGSPVSLGGTLTLSNTGVTSNVAGTGISLNQGTGAVTITNTGVLSVVGGTGGSAITGALTLANAQTSGATITIDDATTAAKGIASFNSTNFSVSSGAVNTIQNIDTGAAPTFTGLTLSGFTGNNAVLYGTAGSGLLASATTNSTGQCLISGASNPTWGSCDGAGFVNVFEIANGAIRPGNTTLDLLIGGASTSSAKFAVLNVSNGTPTASVSAGTTGGLFVTADGSIQTTAKQSLTLGGGNTGNVVISGLTSGILHSNASGVLSSSAVNLGSSDVTGTLTVGNGGTGVGTFGGTNTILYTTSTDTLSSISSANNAALITDGSGVPSFTTAGNDQVLRANGSGTLAFGSLDLSKAGTVGTSILGASNGGTGFDSSASTGVAVISSGTWSALSQLSTALGGLGANVTAAGAGELLYSTSTTTYGHLAAAGSTGLCLTSGGAGAPSWTSCTNASNSPFQASNGSISQLITSQDVLLGGSSTDAAKFAFIGNNSARGQQVASISGNLVLDAAGSLQTTNNQTLTVGGSTTGNILLNSDGNNFVGIGTADPGAKLALAGGNFLHTASGNPTLKGTASTSGGAFDVKVRGKYAYVASDNFEIFDISDPANPVQVGINTAVTSGTGLYVSGNFAYVMDYTTGLNIFDISQPSAPTLVGNYDITGNGWSVYVSGKYAYIAGYQDGLLIVDISDPTSPKLTGRYNTNGNAFEVIVVGKYAYVADDIEGFKIIDVSKPSQPTLVGNIGGGSIDSAWALYVSGNYAYVSNGTTGLEIIDITNPSAPTIVSTLNTSGSAEGVFVGGKYAYLADQGSGLQVVDVSNPTSPSIVGAYNTSGTAHRVAVSGKYAYVADQTGGLKVIDINGTETPSLYAGNILSNYLDVSENASIGNNLYVANGLNIGTGGLYSSGGFSFVTTSGVGNLIQGESIGKALLILNQTGNQDIFAASSAGSTKFVIKNDGTASSSAGFTIDGAGNIQSTNGQTLAIGGGTSGNLVLGATGKNINFASSTFANCTALETVNGVLGCGTDDAGQNFWQYNPSTGIVANGNLTTDLLLGGTTTASARIAFLNIAGGTPTASISAGANGALILTADGSIETTSKQQLRIGGGNSGNVFITTPNGATGADAKDITLRPGSGGATFAAGNINIFGGNGGNPDNSGGNVTIAGGTGPGAGSGGNVYIEGSHSGTSHTGQIYIGSNASYTGYLGIGNASIATTFLSPTFTASALDTFTTSATLGVTATTLNLGGGSAATIGTISDDNLSLSPNGTGDIRLVNDADTDIIAPFFTTAGGLLYTNGSGVFAQTGAGTGTQCLLGGATPTWGSCDGASSVNVFEIANGTARVGNTTLDLLVGGATTDSAKFAIIGISNARGQQTASLSGNLVLDAAGSLQTTNKQTLTIGGNTTGEIQFLANNNSNGLFLRGANAAIGNQSPQASLDVSSSSHFSATTNKIIWGSIGNTMGTLGYDGGAADEIRIGAISNVGLELITNDAVVGYFTNTGNFGVGTTNPLAKLDVAGSASVSGNITLDSAGLIETTGGQNLTLGGGTSGNLIIGQSGKAITLPGFTGQNGVLFASQTTGILGQATTSTTGLCLISGASSPAWGSCDAASSVNVWDIRSGTAQLANTTLDLLVGGVSTDTAKFAITGINSTRGSQIATLSGSLVLDAAGSLQTTKNQTLTIGGSTTGNILLRPINGSGFVGINNLNPNAYLDIASISNTATAINASASALTNGKLLSLNATVSPLTGGIQTPVDIALTNSSTTNANTLRAVNVGINDNTNLENALYGVYVTGNVGGGTNNNGYYGKTFTGGFFGPNMTTTGATDSNNSVIGVEGSPRYTGTVGATQSVIGGAFNPYTMATSGTGFLYQYGVNIYSQSYAFTGQSTNTGIQVAVNHTVDTAGFAYTYGINVANGTTSTVGNTTKYGIHIDAQSGSDNNYALCFDCDGTWSSSTTASGIQFGTDSGGVTLYRNGNNALKTDDQLQIAAGNNGNMAALIVNQNGSSGNDILAASASGTTKFVIKNDGTASSSAGFTIDGVGNIQSTKNQSLTIGGSTTGNIFINPLNGQGKVSISGSSSNPGNLLAVGNSDAFAVNGLGQVTFNPASASPAAGFLNRITPVAPGSTGTTYFENTDQALPVAKYQSGYASYNGYVYLVGGQGGTSSHVFYAKMNPDGTISPWTQTNSLPGNRYLNSVVAYRGYIYSLGGNDLSNPSAVVYYAKINSDGTLGTWTSTNSLGAARQAGAAVAYDGYMYYFGGNNAAAGLTNTYSAPINADGSLGTFTGQTALNPGRDYATAVAYNGYVYLIGGINASATVIGTVHSATLSQGSIGSWNTTNALPGAAARQQSAAVLNNGRVYVTGGSSTAISSGAQTTVYSATLDNGVATWSTVSTSLPTLLYKHMAGVANGFMYIFGGQDNGSSAQTKVYSVPLQSVGYAFNTMNSFGSGNLLDIWNGNVSKFAIDYAGNITASGGAVIKPTIDATNALGIADSMGIAYVNFDSVNRRLGIGTNAPQANLDIQSATSAVASISATSNATGLVLGGDGSIQSVIGSTLTIGGGTSGNLVLGQSGKTITLPGYTGQNGVLYGSQTTGILGQATTSSTGLCLLSGVSAPSWGSCPVGTGTSQWDITAGAIYSGNTTLDLLLGGTSTTSAKFAILNVNSGTPTASISANSGFGALYISGNGVIASTAKQSITIGDNNSGNITLNPGGSTGTVNVNGILAAKTSGGATIVVAASDSSAKGKLQADYVATGTNDDTTIETAIAALPSTGGSVVLLDGTYNIGNAAGDGVDITKSNVTLTGQGRSTILKRQGNAAAIDGIITIGDNGTTTVTGIVITNLSIDGTKATYASTNNYGVFFDERVTQSRLEKTWIYNIAGVAIRFDGAIQANTYNTIINNDIRNIDSVGISIYSSPNNTVSNNNIYNAAGSSLHIYQSSNTSALNNVFDLSGFDGIYVFQSNDLTINSNTISNSDANGIQFENTLSSRVTVAGNIIYNSGQNGIEASALAKSTITGNIIDGLGLFYDGIVIDNPSSDNNIISSNRINDSGSGSAGIHISSATVDNTLIIGNDITGGIAKVVDNGTGTTQQQRNQFAINGASIGKALLTLNQTGDQDIIAASLSGTTVFRLTTGGIASASGGFTVNGAGNIQSTNGQTLSIGGGTSGNLVLGQSGKTINFGSSAFANCSALETVGGIISCGTDDTGITSYDNFWQYNSSTGIVANGNLTTDLLLGATATDTAKFAFIGNSLARGQQTASLSGNLVLDAAGSLQTTNNQTLTLGGSTTGNIILLPQNGNGFVGIGTSTPTAPFELTKTYNSATGSQTNYGSNINVTNTGAVAVGPDVTFGQKIELNRSGASAGSGVFTFGEYINATASGRVNQQYGSYIYQSGGEINYAVNATAISNADSNSVLAIAGGVFGAQYQGTGSVISQLSGVSTAATVTRGNVALATGIDAGIVASGGTITTAYAARIGFSGTGSTIQDGYSLFIKQPSAATFTNAYGLYISNHSLVGSSNSYNFYSAGTNAKNYFAGRVGIGETATTPNNLLLISGDGRNNAALAINQTAANADLLTASASGTTKFVIKNDGTASSSAGFTIDGTGNIQSTKNQTLTIGGNTTGNISFKPGNSSNSLFLSSNGNVGIGTTNPLAPLQIDSTNSEVSLLLNGASGVFNGANYIQMKNIAGQTIGQIGDTDDLDTAFRINAVQNDKLLLGGSNKDYVEIANGMLGIGTVDTSGFPPGSIAQATLHVTRPLSLAVTGKALAIFDQLENQDIFSASSSGVAKFTITNSGGIKLGANEGVGGYCLLSGGAGSAAAWGSCASESNGNWFTLQGAQGTLFPINTTLDFLWGGTATSSAGFRLAGATQNYGTVAVASVSAKTSYAGLVVDNSGTGDILAASSSGFGRFVVKNSGNVGIGTDTPSERLTVNGNIKIESQTNSVTGPTKVTQTQSGKIVSGASTELIASISASAVFNGSLYVGTARGNAPATGGGAEIYRYKGSSGNWELVTPGTAGQLASTTGIASISAMMVYNGNLYVGTSKTDQAEVYRYGGGTSWTRLNSSAGAIAGNTNVDGIISMAVVNGKLYLGTEDVVNGAGGGQVIRYNGGSTFTAITTTAGQLATGINRVPAITSMVGYGGSLFVGIRRGAQAGVYVYNGTPGATSFTLASGTIGTPCTSGAASTSEISTLTVYNGRLYLGTVNQTNGAEVCAYQDQGFSPTSAVSTVWSRITSAAGTIYTGGTTSILAIRSMAVYNGKLYIGTDKTAAGEVYQYNDSMPSSTGQGGWAAISSSAGTIAAGGTSSIDKVTNLIAYNNQLFIGTGEVNPAGTPTNGGAEIYTYQSIVDQSYALKFHAASGAGGGEANGLSNDGSIWFQASSSGQLNNGAGTGSFMFSHGLITNAGAYDVAEDYPTRDTDLKPGDVVEIQPGETGYVRRSTGAYSTGLIGVYSENPGFRLSQTDPTIDGAAVVPVALAGRVPVRVSTENGPIQSGDYLTSSSVPGVAMKATRGGNVIGKAMEPYTDTGEGKILAYVNASQTIGDVSSGIFAQTGMGTVGVDQNSNFATFLNINGQQAGGLKQNSLGGISYTSTTTGYSEWYRKADPEEVINPHEMVCMTSTGVSKCANSNGSILGVAAEAGAVEANSAHENDPSYVLVVLVGQAKVHIKGSVATNDPIGASAIAGTGSKVESGYIIGNALENGSENSSDSAVLVNIQPTYKIDTLGMGSSLPTTVSTNNTAASTPASDDLTTRMTNAEDMLVTDRNKIVELIGNMDKVSDRLKKLEEKNNITLTPFSSTSGQLVTTIDELLVYGAGSFTNASVADTLQVGNSMKIDSNSINTVDDTLSIQSLKQGAVDIMSGAVRIETNGELTVNENAHFNKDVEVKGVLSATSINLKTAPYIELNDTEASSSAMAHTSNIKAGRTTRKIYNPNVKAGSLIYITLKSKGYGLSPYVADQEDGKSFTVELETALPEDLEFNYLIVN